MGFWPRNYRAKQGRFGEETACQYLIEKGYKIIKRNYQRRVGEIDIIAQDPDNQNLVFIEVKARTNYKFGQPEEAVNFKKQDKLIKTAFYFLQENKIKNNFRFDVVAVDLAENGEKRIRHLKNILG